MAALYAMWAVAGSAWIFPQLSANSDEGIYLLQADALSSGHLAPPAPNVDADAYLPWFAVVRDDTYVLKYTPVHAATLATSDFLLGTPRIALAGLAAAQVVLVAALARELGTSRRAALVSASLFMLSPLVLQLSITYLAYGTGLVLLLGATIAALRAVRTENRALATLAGVAWGLSAFARPYDALLGALIVAGAIAVRERHRLLRTARLALWTALGAVGPLLLLLLFNNAMTGDPLQLPFTLLEPLDRPGFGLRRALPTDTALDYTPSRAFAALGRNLLLVVAWTAGGVLTCALALVTLARRRLHETALLVALLVIWPLGYAFFWGSYLTAYVWDGALFLGPYYYLPMVTALAIAGAVTLTDLWRWRRVVGSVTTFGVVLLSAGVAVPALADQRQRTSQRVEVADAIAAAVDQPALVFIPPLYGPYLQNPFSFLRNDPALDGAIVYALDRGDAANERIQAQYADRTAYRLILTNGWSDQPGFEPKVLLLPLTTA